MASPRPLPSAILKLTGSHLAKGREKSEIQGVVGDIRPMECVQRDPVAAQIFDELVKNLDGMRILRQHDATFLSLIAMNKAVLERPQPENMDADERKQRYLEVKEATANLFRFGDAFGMSPKARVGLAGQKAAEPEKGKSAKRLLTIAG